MKIFSDQRGQTTIVMALSIFSLCGMAGLATDVGTLFRAKRVLQTAADASAIAAAAEGKFGDDNATAIAVASLNGVTNGSNGYTVTESVITAGYQVVASEAAPTFFMKLFGLNSMTVSATAIANNGPASACIYALDPSGTDIGMTGSGSLNLPDCGIVVNSASSSAINLTGSGTISAESVGIVGGYSVTGSGGITPTPVTGIAPAGDPLAYLSAPSTWPSCLGTQSFTGSTNNTIGPSTSGGTVCYSGISNVGSGNLTLQPGVYVITGSMSSTGSGNISGTGVTIYLKAPSGSLTLTGSGSLNISAPTDPNNPYNGILFFEDRADTHAMSVTGSGNSNMQGIFYAPNASLTLTGSSGTSINADLVVHALTMTGSGNFGNYSSINPNEPLTAAKLVQ